MGVSCLNSGADVTSLPSPRNKKTIETQHFQWFKKFIRTTYGIRTRDSSVKGRRLNPLTNAAVFIKGGKDNLRLFCCQIFSYSNKAIIRGNTRIGAKTWDKEFL